MSHRTHTRSAIIAAIAMIVVLLAVSCAAPATPQVIEKIVTLEAIPSPIKASWTWPAPREYGPEQSVA